MTSLAPEGMTAVPGSRLDILDVIRGVAIIGVAVYHLGWDLYFLQFSSTDVTTSVPWVLFARSLASTFLLLVGVNLVLAHRRGMRWAAFRRRLALVAVAAAAISGVTYLLFPYSFIYFGILHAIALFSVIALPFLWTPLWLVLTAAFFVLVLPNLFRSSLFDERTLSWIGFATQPQPSVDYVPVFPWFAVTLLGVALARLVFASPLADRLAAFRAEGAFSRTLALAGRWSLVIYLVHQPVLLGILYPMAVLMM